MDVHVGEGVPMKERTHSFYLGNNFSRILEQSEVLERVYQEWVCSGHRAVLLLELCEGTSSSP